MIALQRHRSGRAVLLALGLLTAQACSDGPSEPAVPASIAASATVPAAAPVATSVPAAVVVLDEKGKPIRGAQVTFEPAGGGTVASATVKTDGNGVASGTWTLGTKAGAQTLSARAASLPGVTFTVDARPAPPASIAAADGNPSTGTAGLPVEPTPGVVVLDQYANPVPNVQVTFTTGPGSGTVQGGVQGTDEAGIARPGAWLLGSGTGQQTLQAKAVSFTTQITVTAAAGAPSVVTPIAGNNQSATVGTALQTRPAVRVTDNFGNGIAGVTVEFAVVSGGGAITGATQVSDGDGIATLGAWTLGTTSGEQKLSAAIPGATATITASALPGPAVRLAKAAGDGQEAPPNAPVDTPPAVRVLDRFDNGVPNIGVTFEVLTGGGAVARTSAVSDEAGTATPGVWALGPTAGENTLRASRTGMDPVTFTATAKGEPVASYVLAKFAGDQTTCPVNSTDCRFTVLVTSAVGQPASGQEVTWTAGTETRTTATDSHGRASAPNLAQGVATGTATQTARLVSTGSEVTFSYELVQAGQFNIDVQFLGSATASQQAIFTRAKERWEQVITGNLPAVSFTSSPAAAGTCGVNHPTITGSIDDLRLYIEVVSIDGVGGTLGMAGPCYIRNSSSLPVVGVIKLDSADVVAMESNGTLYDVVVHEMGHTLGIGTLWSILRVIEGAGSADPYFTGARAKSGFVLAGGVLSNGVPVENTGGSGTRDGHWRESVFATELMTGYINNAGNPLSAMTIASLMDLGYQVNFGVAETYLTPNTSGLRALMAEPDERHRLRELPPPIPRRIR